MRTRIEEEAACGCAGCYTAHAAIAQRYPFGDAQIMPLGAGEALAWRLA